jgi:integrase
MTLQDSRFRPNRLAVDDGRLIAKNPAARTKFPPMRRTTHTYLTAREVADLAEACGDQGDVVLILAYSGLRFGELTGLNVEDVDVEARRIRVRRSITQVGGRLVEGNPKSDAGRRSVPIPERLVPALKARLGNRPRSAPAITSPRGSRLGWRTGSGRSTGNRQSPRSAETRCGCTTCVTRTPRYPAELAPTFACCRKPWGMRP